MSTTNTLLDRILDFDNLHTAWQHVRTHGQTPGVDDWSAKRFARNWEENLRTLADEVRANRYQPKRLRVRHIPKKSGGLRRLGIMTLRDRILQRAGAAGAGMALRAQIPGVLLRLSPQPQPLSCSRRCAALSRPRLPLGPGCRHRLLLRQPGPRRALAADRARDLGAARAAPAGTVARCRRRKTRLTHTLPPSYSSTSPPSPTGVSQGMPISPLLCNVYLHELDCKVLQRARRPLVRYADDFIVLAHTQEEAERSQEMVAGYLEQIKLSLDRTKTHITSFDDGFEFLGVRFDADSYHYTWEGKQIEVTGGPGRCGVCGIISRTDTTDEVEMRNMRNCAISQSRISAFPHLHSL